MRPRTRHRAKASCYISPSPRGAAACPFPPRPPAVPAPRMGARSGSRALVWALAALLLVWPSGKGKGPGAPPGAGTPQLWAPDMALQDHWAQAVVMSGVRSQAWLGFLGKEL